MKEYKIKVENRFKVTMKRIDKGVLSGQDIKAIVEFQLRKYVQEEDEPFNDEELAIIAYRMTIFN
jgi:hypothetical protein